MAGAAAVNIQEIDMSTRVASFAGVIGAMVVPAKKGRTDVPVLTTNDADYLNRFTPNGRVEVGYDLSNYSALAFLERSTALWIKRVANQAYFSGLSIKQKGGSVNQSLPNGSNIIDPAQYVFDQNDDVDAVAQVEEFVMLSDVSSSLMDTGIMIFDAAGDSYAIYADIGNVGGVAPAWTVGATNIVAVTTIAPDSADNVVADAFSTVIDGLSGFSASINLGTLTVTRSVAGAVNASVNNGVASSINVVVAGADAINGADEALLIYGSSEGVWADDIAVTIITHEDDEDLVPEDESFLINVFKKGALGTPVEQFWASLSESKKDGYGRNMFVEKVLEASNYIRAVKNVSIDAIYPKSQPTAIFLNGGDDGLAVTDSNMIAAVQDFSNPDDIYFNVLMDGGYSVPAYQIAMNNICITRMDCVAILSAPFEAGDNNDYINELVNYRKNELNLNSSYSALYATHVLITDRFNDRKIWVSPDGYIGAQISYSSSNYEIWSPPAGYTRGIINVEDVRRRFSKGEMDTLQNVGINPIRFAPGKGITIWGQRTLLSKPSALDRLNVRLLLIVIEPAIADFLEYELFELNTRETRLQVTSKIETYMDDIRARKGVYDYSVICDESNNTAAVIDNYKMICDLFIKPSKSIEEIPFRVVIVNSDASFSDAAQAL
jgi:hypothetical protein